MFVCAGNGEDFGFAKKIGVGLIQSAINLSFLCKNRKVESLIFIGSAGSYSKDIKIFDFFSADCATQIEASYLINKSYTPLQNMLKSDQNVSCETIKKIDSLEILKVIVNSSNYINTDKEFSKKILKCGIVLENMEFFSVLSVANMFKIPARGIFCVSNYCYDQAHQEFIKNHQEVIKRLEEYLREFDQN